MRGKARGWNYLIHRTDEFLTLRSLVTKLELMQFFADLDTTLDMRAKQNEWFISVPAHWSLTRYFLTFALFHQGGR